jgi:hypothetical protein
VYATAATGLWDAFYNYPLLNYSSFSSSREKHIYTFEKSHTLIKFRTVIFFQQLLITGMFIIESLHSGTKLTLNPCHA